MSGEPDPSPRVAFRPVAGVEYLSEGEVRMLDAAGYGGSVGAGLEHPVLLVVDATRGFCGADAAADLEDAVAVYPHACGRSAWAALPRIRALVDGARRHDVPIVFTRPFPPDRRPGHLGRWEDKNHRRVATPADAYDVVGETGFRPTDTLLEKDCPSAFFGTPLSRWLHGMGVDGVVVCGGSTSGCVRATVVDAFSHDLRVVIAADATFDRLVASHRVTLLDLELKYADVATADGIVRGWA